MGKWTRRTFIGAGVAGAGALIVGVAIRPGNRAPKVMEMMAGADESLINLWLKIASDNTVTVIAPHSEMGQGAQTALAMMLADELDADWNLVKFAEAPAHPEYANYHLARGFIIGEAQVPSILMGTVDGVFRKATQHMGLQVTGGSASIR
ncbi:MAG: molybdopterin-dependent oxidoreductase, partial [Gammaproteobacteria bacterium]|nr:molybdopterin-dependent oxidoreductase [Gammaproteobacteria bacterium]